MSDPFSPQGPPPSGAGPQPPTTDAGAASVEGTPSGAPLSAATLKFKSCRWRRPPEDGTECCGHRDVLPIAGTSFNPEAWCPDCAFFKLRRTPKKRSPDEYRY